MRIKEISIRNYRQYQKTDLFFSNASTYDLNYILAENGIGKTTLLNAITWCLYNTELHTTEGLKDKTLPLITLQTMREMKPEDEETTSIKITLEDLDCDVIFERSIVFRMTNEGEPYEKERLQKVILAYKNRDPEVRDDEESFDIEVNKRLPFAIQQFFFFDGEQLDTYIANNTGKDIEKTVLDMSQIGLLVQMEHNLRTIHTEMRRRVSGEGSAALKAANENLEMAQEKVDTKEEELKKLNEEYKLSKNRLASIKEELGDEPDIADLEETRDDLIEKRDNAEEDLTKKNQEIKEFLTRSLMLLNSMPKIRQMYDIIKEKEDNRELPPKYDKDELEKMLSEERCFVCGRGLDTDAKVHLLGLIKRYEMSQETGKLLNRIYGVLDGKIREASRYEAEKDKLFSEQEKIKTELSEAQEQLSAIEILVNQVTDKERIKKLYAEREDLEKALEQASKRIGREEAVLESLQKERDKMEREYKIALDKDKKHKEQKAQMVLTAKAESKVAEIISNIKDDIRQQISDEMSGKFFELMWKNKFSKVEITEGYNASVINQDGLECLGSCSAAERELLALAFTLALHKESGFDGPLVIDTPISRISGKLRVNFAEVLREVSKDKQIILFITEDEYSTNIRDVFEPCANKKYVFNLVNEEFVKVGEM